MANDAKEKVLARLREINNAATTQDDAKQKVLARLNQQAAPAAAPSRASSAVQTDLTALDSRIKALQDEQKALNRNRLSLEANLAQGSIGGNMAQDEAVLAVNAARQRTVDNELAELSKQRYSLTDELNKARYGEYSALASKDDYAAKSTVATAQNSPYDPNLWRTDRKAATDLITRTADEDKEEVVLDKNFSAYQYMTDEELGIYNYLRNTEGDKAAKQYLDLIVDYNEGEGGSLKYREGKARADRTFGKGEILALGASAGLERFGSGMRQLGKKDAQTKSSTQYAAEIVSGQLGKGMGVAFDVTQAVGNMAPSILLSTVAPALGMASFGAAAGGNAYTEKVREGYDPDNARTYAVLVGLSEVALQRALGGIAQLGGGAFQTKVAQKIANIDNAIGRVAAKVGYSSLAEGFEEGLQETLEPVFATIALEDEFSPAEVGDVAYSFLLGALTGGLFEGVNIAATEPALKKQGKEVRKQGNEAIQRVIERGLAADEASPNHKLAAVLQERINKGKRIGNYQLGRLQKENEREGARGLAEYLVKPEEEEYGREDVLDESSERNDGTDSGQPAGELDEGAGRTEADWQTQQRSAAESRRTQSEAYELTPVSSVLGKDAAADAAVRFIPEDAHDEELREIAERTMREVGSKVRFFTGEMRLADGKVTDGVQMPDGSIYVRADSEDFTATQVTAHEEMHVRIRQDGELFQAEKERVRKKFGKRLDAMMLRYADAYDGVSTGSDYLLEEIICDAYAGMNKYGTTASAAQETVRSEVDARKPKQDTGTDAGRAPPKKKTAKEELAELNERYGDGTIGEEEYDAAYDAIMSRPDMADLESVEQVKFSVNDADMRQLRLAKEMQDEGVGEDTIERKTGWRMINGKWENTADPDYYKVAPDDGVLYNDGREINLSEGEYARVQSAILTRFADKMKPQTNRIFLFPNFYVFDRSTEDYAKIWLRVSIDGNEALIDAIERSFADNAGSYLYAGLYDKSNEVKRRIERYRNYRSVDPQGGLFAGETGRQVDSFGDGRESDRRFGSSERDARSVEREGATYEEQNAVEEPRFSLSKPVEETRDLLAVHNLHASELAKTLELGGMPMPSIAVIKAEQGHEDYGDVSVIFPKDVIDPQRGSANKVYGGGAWTPVYPRIEYKPREKVAQKIRDKYYGLGRQIGYEDIRPLYRYVNELEDTLNREGGEAGILEKLYDDTDMMQVYLLDSGKEKVEPVVKEIVTEISAAKAEMNQFFIDALGEDTIANIYVRGGASPIMQYRAFLAEHEAEVRDVYKRFCMEVFGFSEAEADNVLSKTTERDLMGFLRDANQYTKNKGVMVRTETDLQATREAIRNAVVGDDYRGWVNSLFKGVEEKSGIRNNAEYYTRSGNPRSWNALHWENTLENVVKVMKGQQDSGVGSFSPFTALFGAAHKRYGSIAEIKADSGRLGKISEDEYEAMKEDFSNRFAAIADTIKDPAERNPFIARDNAAELIVDAVRTQKTKASMLSYLQRWNKRATMQTVDDVVALVADIANMPTGYFEAKPQRAVGFDEVGVFVIPNNADPALKQRLTGRGYRVAEYDPAIEGDRKRVVNQFDDLRFSFAGDRDMSRDTMTRKAADTLASVERYFSDDLATVFSVPQTAKRDFLKPIVAEISDEYFAKGEITKETLDTLFNTAYEQGRVVDESFLRENAHIKHYLRTTGIRISKYDSADIADWPKFRKSLFGRVLLKNDGINVSKAWQELQKMNPSLFPENVTHPADQLQRMAEAYNIISAAEYDLAEVYGEAGKEWLKNDFAAKVNRHIAQLANIRRYEDDRAAARSGANDVELTTQQAMDLYGEMMVARRTYEKARNKVLLTTEDEHIVSRLLLGEITEDVARGLTPNIGSVLRVYRAKVPYEMLAKQLAAYKATIRRKYREAAAKALENSAEWQDKNELALNRETPERVFEMVMGEDAPAMIKEYLWPVHVAEANKRKMINRYRDRVRRLELSREVDEGNLVSESYMVQMLGEAQHNIRYLEEVPTAQTRGDKTLEEWRAVVSKLWAENPNMDEKKIKEAIYEFQRIYDELYQGMNAVRVENGYEPIAYRHGYFPHFQPGENDGILDSFGKIMGLNTDVTSLPTTISGLTHTFRPGITYFGHIQQRVGFETVYDAVEGFEKYIHGAADMIYHTKNIQKLRALENEIRYRSTTDGIRVKVDELMARTSLTTEEKSELIENEYQNAHFRLNSFVKWLREYTNHLANKKSGLDRETENLLGRGFYEGMGNIMRRVSANMVAINPGSWLTNIIPLTQARAVIDGSYLLDAMHTKAATYGGQTLPDDYERMVANSVFLANRRHDDPLVSVWEQTRNQSEAMRRTRKAAGQWEDKLSRPMEVIDYGVAEVIVRARYKQNLDKGLSEAEALAEADQMAARIMAGRSKGEMPNIFHGRNPLLRLFTQFQLEVNNQLSFLFKDIPKEYRDKGKEALAMALFMMFLWSWLYNQFFEMLTGRRAALDPFEMLNEFVGDTTGYEIPSIAEAVADLADGENPFETERKGIGEAVAGLGKDVAENVPFVGGLLGGGRLPISSALPKWSDVGTALAPWSDWNAKKRAYELSTELSKPLAYIAMPFGGGQLKKVLQGLSALARGGSYSVNAAGEDILQYPVFTDSPLETAVNAAKVVTFGKSSLPSAVDWVDTNFDSMSTKETALYRALVDTGEKQHLAYDFVRGLSATDGSAEKREYIVKSKLTGDAMAAAYYTLASDKEKVALENMADTSNMDIVVPTMAEIRNESKQLGKFKALADSRLDDGEYMELMQTFMSEDSFETIRKATEHGLSVEAYVKVRAMLDAYDANNNGSYSQSEIEDAVDALTGGMMGLNALNGGSTYTKYLTIEERAILWQVLTGSKNATSNPYSKSAAQQYLNSIK